MYENCGTVQPTDGMKWQCETDSTTAAKRIKVRIAEKQATMFDTINTRSSISILIS